MKLEVGMYVRTDKGQIGKITNFDGAMARVDTDKFITYKDFNNEITKASHNIIDLIEVGDYVNGFPVIHKENDILKCGLLVQFKENEIKSIVTKEQFESIKYSLEG